MKFRYKLIFFAIGLAGIGILLWKADLPNVNWGLIFSLDTLALFGVLIGLWIVIYFLHALCYKVILHEESWKINIFSMFKICASGFALNSVTPAGLVGGEPYRIMELKRYCSTEKSTSSTLTFTLLYTFGHIMLWVTAAIAYLVYLLTGHEGTLWVTILVLTSGGILLALLLLFLIRRKNGFAYPVMKFLAKLPLLRKKLGPMVEKNKDSYIEIDDNIREFRNSPGRFTLALGIQYTTRLLEALEYFLLFYFFVRNTGISTNFFDGVLIMGIASLVGNILFVVPMQAATREGGMTIALSFLISSEELIKTTGVGIGLIYRIREFVFIVAGIVMVLVGKRGKKQFSKKELRYHQKKYQQELKEKQEHKEAKEEAKLAKEAAKTEPAPEIEQNKNEPSE